VKVLKLIGTVRVPVGSESTSDYNMSCNSCVCPVTFFPGKLLYFFLVFLYFPTFLRYAYIAWVYFSA
jgi:hypothetical protein